MTHQQRLNQDALLDKLIETQAYLDVAQEYVAGAEAIIRELEARTEFLDSEMTKWMNRAEWYQRQSQRNRVAINRANARIKELEEANDRLNSQAADVGSRTD